MGVLPPIALSLLGLSLAAWGCEARASQQALPPDALGPGALSLDVVAAPQDEVSFGGPTPAGVVQHDPLREASGLVASRAHPGVLWTHNDSGDGPHLYALTTDGRHLGVFTLSGAEARDWEDLAIGPGPDAGVDYLYAGDIGDNDSQHDVKYVYRVAEPAVSTDQAPSVTSLTGVSRIALRYPGAPSDAETLLVDPLTGDLYVVTKRSTDASVYRAAAPISTADIIEMERSGTLSLPSVPGLPAAGQGAVGGDIAPSGLEVLLKTYTAVYYWRRGSAAEALFARPYQALPYVPEPQGEAIAWAADGSGYFTLSEERQSIPATLYFYPRQRTP
ncbi:MAG: hypothetical protein O2930_00065 [Acidobacteria bacterium]|nr:hypothetical protein [Acidobacteriota bacterium]